MGVRPEAPSLHRRSMRLPGLARVEFKGNRVERLVGVCKPDLGYGAQGLGLRV